MNNEELISRYRSLLSEKDAEIQRLKESIDNQENFVTKLSDCISNRDYEIQQLKEDRDDWKTNCLEANRQIKQLKDWKESAMSVWPDMQKIGELLGIELGRSVHDNIIPAIKELKEIIRLQKLDIAELESSEMEKHGETWQAAYDYCYWENNFNHWEIIYNASEPPPDKSTYLNSLKEGK